MIYVSNKDSKDYELGYFPNKTIYKFSRQGVSVYDSDLIIYSDTNRHNTFFSFLKGEFQAIIPDMIYAYVNDALHNSLSDEKTSYLYNSFSEVLELHPILTTYNYDIIIDEVLSHIFKQYVSSNIKYSKEEFDLIFLPLINRPSWFNKVFHQSINLPLEGSAFCIVDENSRLHALYTRYTNFLTEYTPFQDYIESPMSLIYNTVSFIRDSLDLVYSEYNELVKDLPLNERISLIPIVSEDASIYLNIYNMIKIVNPFDNPTKTDEQLIYKALTRKAYSSKCKENFEKYYNKSYTLHDFSTNEYQVDNFAQGLLLEFIHILFSKEKKNNPKQCSYCHSYFIPTNINAKYCDLATSKKTATCKKIVPSIKQMESIKKDVVLSKINQITSKYTMRLKRALKGNYQSKKDQCDKQYQDCKIYTDIAKTMYMRGKLKSKKDNNEILLHQLQELDKKIDKGDELPCIETWATIWKS